MSRSKFEEWAESEGYNVERDELGYKHTATLDARRGWLAGRESMRDEVCPIVFGQCDSDNVAQRTVDAIKKIEP